MPWAVRTRSHPRPHASSSLHSAAHTHTHTHRSQLLFSPTEKLRGSSAAVEGLDLRFPAAYYYALLASYYCERPAAYEALCRELVPVWANVHLPILFAALAYRAVRGKLS